MKTEQQHLNEHTKYNQFLLKEGVKLSRARETVFWEVMEAHGHFAAEELVKQCTMHNRGVSRATIYRCLKELLASGVIRETAFGEKHHHFEHVYDEELHHHARCIRCYKIIEIPCLDEYREYVALLKKEQFEILGHELHFYGTCRNCINKTND